MISRYIRSALVLAVILVVAALPLYAQDQDANLAREAFIRPPDKIAEAVLAPFWRFSGKPDSTISKVSACPRHSMKWTTTSLKICNLLQTNLMNRHPATRLW